MALPYRKWSEDEIASRNVSAEGDYPFTIVEVIVKKTKGKIDDRGQLINVYPMLELTEEYHDQNGIIKKQKDWIVLDGNMDWKLRHLADSTSLLELYESDSLDAHHLLKKQGVFKLGVKDSDYQGEIRKQNFVKDYVKKASNSTGNDTSFLNDDIPHM